MLISAQTLTQAREALIESNQQKQSLMGQVREQGRKIVDLEREVQRLANTLSHTQQALVGARTEITALRGQLPDAATVSAFEALTEYLTSPAESHQYEMRLVA